jgi:tetratricopeptide (TPR) repeat protein
VKTAGADAPYTLRHIEQMLGLTRAAVSQLVAAGFVTPVRGPRNQLRFSFQDVVLLRTAHALRAAQVPPRRLLRSLKDLRAKLPPTVPLSGLRIKAIGNEVAVREGRAQWEVRSGQLLMDFEIASDDGGVAFLEHAVGQPRGASSGRDPQAASGAAAPAATAAAEAATDDADGDAAFARAAALEARSPAAAIAAYRALLERLPAHADAAINLTAMLCGAGRPSEAVTVARRTLQRSPLAPLLWFNLGIALEDLGRHVQALDAYEQCLKLDATLADAHFNAARLAEQLGRGRDALRHYSAYRRLSRAG